MVQLSAEIRYVKALEKEMAKLSGQQARQGYAAALNDTGYHVLRVAQRHYDAKFAGVTPYIRKSEFVQQATADKLTVRIAPNNRRDSPGVDPQKILQAQEFGGRRRDKRSEVILRRAGILPSGYQTAIPREPYPGSDDGRGNIRGAFISQLISYFQASAEQGHSANMKKKRKDKLEDRAKLTLLSNKKEVSIIRGRVYFVSYGRMRGSHLAPGIWAKSGIHGVQVKPVLMFVRAGTYRQRISREQISKDADVQNYLDRRVRYRIRKAAGV